MTWKFFKEVLVEVSHCAERARARLEQERRADTSGQDSQSDPADEHTLPEISVPDFDVPSQQSRLDYLHLSPSVCVPEKVLDGPWDDDKAHFLYYLSWLGLRVDWDHSTLGETASSGLIQAVSGQNTLAVATLLSPSIGVNPSQQLLRAAVLEHGCNRTIVFHLVSAAVRLHILARGRASSSTSSDVNFRDPSLWSWAGRVTSEKGRWLKELLRLATDLTSAHSHFDRDVHEEMVLSCGRESDGVEQIKVFFPPA